MLCQFSSFLSGQKRVFLHPEIKQCMTVRTLLRLRHCTGTRETWDAVSAVDFLGDLGKIT